MAETEDIFEKAPASQNPMLTPKQKNLMEFTTPTQEVQQPFREVGRLEAFDAAFDLAQLDTAMNAIARMTSLDELENSGELIEPEQLNKMFIDAPLDEPFNRPMTEVQAVTIVERAKNRQRLAEKISRGPQDYLQTGMNFGAAAAASASDPIEFGAGMLLGAGAGWAARAGYLGTRTARMARLARANRLSPAQNLGIAFAEGFAGNLAAEGVIASANKQENLDYNMGDMLANAATGAILFPGVRYGVNRSVSFVKNFGQRAAKSFDSPMLGRIFNDKKPIADLHIRDMADELYARHKPDLVVGENLKINLGQYVDEALPSIEAGNSRNWFSYSVSRSKTFDVAEANQIELDMGRNAVELSTDPGIVYNAANRKMFDDPGVVHAHRIDMTGVRSFDELPIKELREPFIEAMKKLGFKDKMASSMFDNSPSMRSLYDDIRNNIDYRNKNHQKVIDEFNEASVERGVNGYFGRGGDFMGNKGRSHNSLVLLNKDNIKEQIDRIETDKARTHQIPQEEIQKRRKEYDSEENDIFYDADASKEFKELEFRNVDSEPRLANLDKREREALEELALLADQGSELAEGVVERVNKMKRQHVDNLKMRSALKACMNG